MDNLFNMFTRTDHAFLEKIWDPSTVSPEDLILTKPNLTSGSQEANILFPHMGDFRYNHCSDVAMAEAVDIAPENMDAFVDNMDIDNALLQNFLHEPTISADCLDPEEFGGDWTDPDLTFALFDEMMKDLDQHIRSEQSISDNPPDGVDMLDELPNQHLESQSERQLDEPKKLPDRHLDSQLDKQPDEQPRERSDEFLHEQLDKSLDEQPNQHLDSQSDEQPDEYQDGQPREEPNDQANEEDERHFYVEDVEPCEQPWSPQGVSDDKNRVPGRSSANPIIIDDVDYRTHEMQSTQHRRSSRTRKLTTLDNDEMLRYSEQYDLTALVDEVASEWEQIQADWIDMSEVVGRYQYPEIEVFEKNLLEEATDICLSQRSRHSPGIGKMLADLWKNFCIRLEGNDEISETERSYAGLLGRFAKHERILYLREL